MPMTSCSDTNTKSNFSGHVIVTTIIMKPRFSMRKAGIVLYCYTHHSHCDNSLHLHIERVHTWVILCSMSPVYSTIYYTWAHEFDVIPSRFISWKKKLIFLYQQEVYFAKKWLGRLTDCTHCTGQFTPKMKANAEPRLLSSLVWIDSGVVVSQHCWASLLS